MQRKSSIRRTGELPKFSDGGIIIKNKNNEGQGYIVCNVNNIW